MWPKTDHFTAIPLPEAMPDGTLDTLDFWVYDEETTTVVIQTSHRTFLLINPEDLLRFRQSAIARLAMTQLIVDKTLFEEAAKEWTSMVAQIMYNGIHAGPLYGTGVKLVIKP